MFHVLNNLICAALLSINPSNEPITNKALPFEASAYVTLDHQIRLSVVKSSQEPVVVLLRNTKNEVLFTQTVGRKMQNYALKMDVSSLQDGAYELEIKSSEGAIRKQVELSSPVVQKAQRLIVMD
jgi:hypothetical protein